MSLEFMKVKIILFNYQKTYKPKQTLNDNENSDWERSCRSRL